ncbi:MAG: hypothetical protein QM529_06795 [Hydrotalea sp.]|nr:hypothetical protein [Hydrotalea sp.]
MLPISLPRRLLFSLSLKHGGDAAGKTGRLLPIQFLEKIITADTKPLESGAAIYSALLTANGKYIADFFIVPRDNELLVEVDKSTAASLMAQLQKYILRQPIEIKLLEQATVAVAFAPPTADDIFFITDPRPANKKCYRLYGKLANYADDQTDYTAWRIDNLLPEGPDDFEENESMIVEYHLQNVGGLSLQKGCFVGQEVTARMYYKQTMMQKLKKQLVKKIIAPDAPPQDGDKILSSVTINHQKHVLVLEKSS